jgi:hypothetical protein
LSCRLRPRCGEVRGSGAEELAIDLIAFEVHRCGGLELGPDIHGVSVTQSPSLPS